MWQNAAQRAQTHRPAAAGKQGEERKERKKKGAAESGSKGTQQWRRRVSDGSSPKVLL